MNTLRAGIVAWGLLALLHLLWHAWLAPPAHSTVLAALLISLLPLALPLLAWRRPKNMLLVAGMVCLFYFAHGIAELWGTPSLRGLAMVEIVLSLTVIVCVGLGAWAAESK